MKILTLNCPNCGASFDLPEGKTSCFCQNCGTKMLIDDGQIYININQKTENVSRIVNEAEIEKQKAERARYIGAVVLGIVALIVLLIVVLFI